MEHLLGEALADLVLKLAAVLEECGEPLRARQAQEAGLAEQEPERSRDRPARGLDHVGHAEVEPARALPARCGDEPQRVAVEEEPRGNSGARDHEAGRTDEAEPFEVRQDRGIEPGLRHQFVSGHR